MNLVNSLKLKRRSLMLVVSLSLALLVLSTEIFGSAYEYFTLAQTNFSFDSSSTVYYEYGTTDSNTVTVNQTLNASLNALANYSSYYSAIAHEFRDTLNYAGNVRCRVYQPNQNAPGLSTWHTVRLSNNLNLNYYLDQISDYMGDNSVAAITLSFRAAAFYSGSQEIPTPSNFTGKFNFLGYNILASDFDYFSIQPASPDPNAPSPNGYGLSGDFSINILVDDLSDIFNTTIPFFFELSGFTSSINPSQASLLTGFVMSDISLSIGFDRSVQELIDVNQNLIDLRGDLADIQDSLDGIQGSLGDVEDMLDLINNPYDSSWISPDQIPDGWFKEHALETAEASARSYIRADLYNVRLSFPDLTAAYVMVGNVFNLLISTGIGPLVLFACSFGLACFIIGQLHNKF